MQRSFERLFVKQVLHRRGKPTHGVGIRPLRREGQIRQKRFSAEDTWQPIGLGVEVAQSSKEGPTHLRGEYGTKAVFESVKAVAPVARKIFIAAIARKAYCDLFSRHLGDII